MAKGPNGNIHPTRIFSTPPELTVAWEAFKDDLKEQANNWQVVQYVGREGDRKTDSQKVPMTFEGFKRYCTDHYGCVEQYFTNQDRLYEDFIGVCRAIKNEIREDQIIGGMLGMYNASITQRLNNLKEQTDNTNTNTNTNLRALVSNFMTDEGDEEAEAGV